MNLNAKNGIAKIFLAEVLSLVNVLVYIIVAGLSVAAFAAWSTGLAALTALFGVIAFVIGIVALILTFIGLSEAKKDNETFGNAIIFIIISIVIAVVSGIASFIPVLGSVISFICSLADAVLNFLVVKTIVTGCAELDGTYSLKANSISGFATIVMVLTIAGSVIGIIPLIGGFIAGLISIANFVVSIIFYVMYLKFLYNYKNM